MRKSSIFLLGVITSVAFTFGGFTNVSANADSTPTVYVGGMSAGFTLKSGNVQVVGLCEVMTENSVSSPALDAGIKAGDCIRKVAGVAVETVEELNGVVNKYKEKTVEIELERNGETQTVKVKPLKDKVTQKYKIGILARDSLSGIGTVTYIEKDSGRFASLGHSVIGENNRVLKIADGSVYTCNIISVYKGVRGRAGELRGMFLTDKSIGKAEKLCDCGIYGSLDKAYPVNHLQSVIADSSDVSPGKAYIYSTVNGVCPQRFEIEIVKVDKWNKENKHYVIKIDDEDLVMQTGGIVQGMSGSPILQDGKLIGAITHVFLNDPTRGYGIDVQTMLKN